MTDTHQRSGPDGCRPRRSDQPTAVRRPSPPPGRQARRPDLDAVVDLLSHDTFRSTVRALVASPTRHSLSTEFRTAAQWAAAVLTGFGYAVRLDPVTLPGGETLNVVADATGTGPDDERRLIHVVAHLDSVNTAGGVAAPAPGADDNASGAAGLLELARVLSTVHHAHDLRLILFGGEEQGLFGSRQYVAQLPQAERDRTTTVLNMDMIARLNDESPSVLLEGAAISQPLIDALAEAAAAYTDLEVFTSLDPFGSDHVPFLEAGVPAVLTIEGADQLNTDEHTSRDTLDVLDTDLAVAILRMNLATVATALSS